jgi:hypothetical protein
MLKLKRPELHFLLHFLISVEIQISFCIFGTRYIRNLYQTDNKERCVNTLLNGSLSLLLIDSIADLEGLRIPSRIRLTYFGSGFHCNKKEEFFLKMQT